MACIVGLRNRRLLNGEYVASNGVITRDHEEQIAIPILIQAGQVETSEKTWDEACEHYRSQRKRRRRRKSTIDSDSRIDIAGRIFEIRRANANQPPGVALCECMTLEAMEFLQDQLLDGVEGRYDFRSPNTVNSMMGAVMAFARFCYNHQWIERIPPVEQIDVNEVMRGRPITGEEFDRMLHVVPKVVGTGPSESWRLVLCLLWESGFRISDIMKFSWDDERQIFPVWPSRTGQHATIVISSNQKNRKLEEIPMLPGLHEILDRFPENERSGFIVNPLPIEYEMKSQNDWFMPSPNDLQTLIKAYSNDAIARACGVKETTVRKWLLKFVLQRHSKITHYGQGVPREIVESIRKRASRRKHQRSTRRLSSHRVSQIISAIGKTAGVIVRQPDEETGQRIKFASAHDLRRSLAQRLINSGVSAETLMVIMRHKSFATTKKFYAASRAAQSAAAEIHQQLGSDVGLNVLVG